MSRRILTDHSFEGGTTVKGLPDPAEETDGANKTYVDTTAVAKADIAQAEAQAYAETVVADAVAAIPALGSADEDLVTVHTDDVDGVDVTFVDPAGISGLLLAEPGALAATGELWLPESVVSAGAAVGGVIRRAQHIAVIQDYTQTVPPTEPSVGTAFLAVMNITANDNTPFIGPVFGSPYFGPRGIVQVEGLATVGFSQGQTLTPIGYSDQLHVRNPPGTSLAITPGWGFMSARVFRADSATTHYNRNDTALGAAAFVNNTAFISENTGESDGTSYDMLGFLDAPFVFGKGDFRRRVAYSALDFNGGLLGSELDLTLAILRSTFPNTDDMDFTLGENGIYEAIHMVGGTRNWGLSNGSATIEPGWAQAVTAATDTLEIDQTLLLVTASADTTLTSTPHLPAGLDGQRIVVLNVGTHTLTVQDEASLTDTGLRLTNGATVKLAQYESITVRYNEDSGLWLEESRSNPFRGSATFDFATSRVDIGDGGGVGPGVSLYVTGESVPRVGLSALFGQAALYFSGGSGTPQGLVRTDATKLSLTNTALEGSILRPRRAVTTSTTIVSTDAGAVVGMTASSAQAVTVPPESTWDAPDSTSIIVMNNGTGPLTLTPDTGVTFRRAASVPLVAHDQYTGWEITKTTTADTWLVLPLGLRPVGRSTFSNADYTILPTDRYVAQIGTMSAVRTLNLPLANSVVAGTEIIVADDSATVTATNAINIWKAVGSSDTITNGLLGYIISIAVPGGALRLISDGVSNWVPTTPLAATAIASTAGDGTVSTSKAVYTFAQPRLPRQTAITSNATWSPVATDDQFIVTAQAAAATTINNPSGTVDGNGRILRMRIKDNGTARALTWSGTQWRASTSLALPTTTTLGKAMYLTFMWDSQSSTWDLTSLVDGF